MQKVQITRNAIVAITPSLGMVVLIAFFLRDVLGSIFVALFLEGTTSGAGAILPILGFQLGFLMLTTLICLPVACLRCLVGASQSGTNYAELLLWAALASVAGWSIAGALFFSATL